MNVVALDLGASSGKAILGRYDGRRMGIQDLHRFPNIPVNVGGTLYWDILRLLSEIRTGLALAGRENCIDGVGIDTWGNDFGLLDKKGKLLANPVHYRDERTLGMMDKAFARVPREHIYRQTGIQFMRFSALYQLFSQFYHKDPQLEAAHTLLLIPDLLTYFLTGEKHSEFTDATTTQMFNPVQMDWARDMLRDLGMDDRLFTDVIPPATVLGGLIDTEVLGSHARMIAVAEHDTGSAVVAVPACEDDFVYISSGTWSLMGTETCSPVINDKTLRHNFTNEGGAFGTFRLLKNIMGLWIVQQCKRHWDSVGQSCTYGQLEHEAWESPPFLCFIDPDDERFASPGNMPQVIREYCRRTGQPVPESRGEVIRCVMESLACRHKTVLARLEDITGKTYSNLYIVGGGVRDAMFCRFIACATGRTVVAGCEDASAVGNIALQVAALENITSLHQVRQLIRDSFPVKTYPPEQSHVWHDAFARFVEVTQKHHTDS